jgi:hypothetical protein
MSFGGRNWLYNNISVDGSYFNNPFGLDDPAPGGQTNAEPIPYDAVAQLQLSIAPFDVREGGFTAPTSTPLPRAGRTNFTDRFTRSAATMLCREIQYPALRSCKSDLAYNQSGGSFSGPLIRDKLFFYVNGEIERTKEPGSNFVASREAARPRCVARSKSSWMRYASE